MKRLFLVLLLLVLVFSISGCEDNPHMIPEDERRFEIVYDTFDLSNSGSYALYTTIFVDKETGIAYIFVRGDSPSGSSGLTVMLDEDGNPLIWDTHKGR
jgi:hypothetical protein